MAKIQELGFPIGAGIMVYGYLGKDKSRILEFLDHLQADRTRSTFQLDLIEYAPPDQSEVTIHIPEFKTKGELDNIMIRSPDDFSEQRIKPCNFIPIDHIDPLMEGIHSFQHLEWIILGISIRVENPFL